MSLSLFPVLSDGCGPDDLLHVVSQLGASLAGVGRDGPLCSSCSSQCVLSLRQFLESLSQR